MEQKNAKIKHTILCCEYADGGLKSVDSLKFSVCSALG